MTMVVATAFLPVVSLAELSTTTYVVPEGTTGNSPAEPYATWATAANDIRTAADAVVTHGVVRVLAGTYQSAAGFMTTRAYEMQILSSMDGGEGAGTATLHNYFFNDPTVAEGPDSHSVLVSKGTLTTSETSAFVDRGSTTKGIASNYKLRFSGDSSGFSTKGGYLYSGYDMAGTSLAFSDGAKCSCDRLYVGQNANGSAATFAVENGAEAALTGVCQCGAEAANCSFIVSNATISAKNYVFGKTATEKVTSVLLAGAAPRMTSSSTAVFYGDTKVFIDVAEMPVGGYENYILYNSGITFEGSASIHITGFESLRARLRQAGVMNLTANVGISFGGGAQMSLPSSIVEATNERLSGSGFSLVVSGAYIRLKYVEQGAFQTPVYVDASSETPTYPYGSWSAAAVSLADADFVLSKGGEMLFASGDYSASFVAPDNAAVYKAFASPTDDSPGAVTIGSTLLPGFAGTNTDPQRQMLTLAYGTFAAPSGSANVFLDSSSSGAAQNSSNRLVVTGTDTVFNDKSHNLYVGYAAKNTHLVVKDGATCNASVVYSGRSGNGAGSTIVVANGGRLDVANQLTMGRQSPDAKLIIDNATVECASFDCGAEGTELNEMVCIRGLAPYFNPRNAISIGGNATLEFDVSEFPLGDIDNHTARIETKDFAMSATAALRIVGVDKLRSRFMTTQTSARTVRYTLLYAWGTLGLTDEQVAAAICAAALPEGWKLEKDAHHLYLTKRLGFIVIVK